MTHTPPPSDTSTISVFEGYEAPVYRPINEHALQLSKCANDEEKPLNNDSVIKKAGISKTK